MLTCIQTQTYLNDMKSTIHTWTHTHIHTHTTHVRACTHKPYHTEKRRRQVVHTGCQGRTKKWAIIPFYDACATPWTAARSVVINVTCMSAKRHMSDHTHVCKCCMSLLQQSTTHTPEIVKDHQSTTGPFETYELECMRGRGGSAQKSSWLFSFFFSLGDGRSLVSYWWWHEPSLMRLTLSTLENWPVLIWSLAIGSVSRWTCPDLHGTFSWSLSPSPDSKNQERMQKLEICWRMSMKVESLAFRLSLPIKDCAYRAGQGRQTHRFA